MDMLCSSQLFAYRSAYGWVFQGHRRDEDAELFVCSACQGELWNGPADVTLISFVVSCSRCGEHLCVSHADLDRVEPQAREFVQDTMMPWLERIVQKVQRKRGELN